MKSASQTYIDTAKLTAGLEWFNAWKLPFHANLQKIANRLLCYFWHTWYEYQADEFIYFLCFSVAKTTLQLQMSIRVSVHHKNPQPLRIAPINQWVYQPSSLLTIDPINHWAYQPSSLLTYGLLSRLLSQACLYFCTECLERCSRDNVTDYSYFFLFLTLFWSQKNIRS